MHPNSLVDRLIGLAQGSLPGWTGANDPRFLGETEYKRQASRKAQDLLSATAVQSLMDAGSFDEFLSRLKKVGQSTNLLYIATPSTGDMAILQHREDTQALALAFQDLLHGAGPSPERLDRFAAFTERPGLPSKWAFPTCLLFLLAPDTEFFVKPTVARWFLELAGEGSAWTNRPSGMAYQRLLDLAAQVLEGTRALGLTDMIDVQSLVWVAREAATKSGIPPGEAFATLLEECVENYLTTPAGSAHLATYPTIRANARETLGNLKTRRAAGADVTVDVLLKCLPHANSQANTAAGAWVHVAPALSGDVRTKFEGAGWRRAEDWPQVARLLLDFFVECDDNPAALEGACQRFSESPFSKGFQTGMVTPFLNALRPDDYTLINNKSRRLVNYFMEAAFKQPLSGYPGTNAAARRLVNAIPQSILAILPPNGHPTDILDALSHWLVTIKKFEFGSRQFWKVAPGEQGWQWDECQREGFIGVGWDELGDLTDMTKADFEATLLRLKPSNPTLTQQGARQAFRFATQIAEGDRIVANRGTSEVLGIGTVTGPYYYQAGATHSHRIPVDWEDVQPRAVSEPGWTRTLIQLDQATFKRVSEAPVSAGPAPSTAAPPPAAAPTPATAYTLETCAEETRIELATLKEWVKALDRKGQAIVYGPPGTGKTFVAERLGRYLAGPEGMIELVQFHPSYAYEDFIQGIRPSTEGGALHFSVRPGRFLEFCERARRVTGKAVLIIDEINRANLSKVFGELMYLLEYRRQTVPLAGGGTFSIPDHVRIIGTMNTADRSVALVDHALRRRFAFIPLFPDFEVLERFHEWGPDVDSLILLLKELNEDIGDRNLAVGISYFLREDLFDHLASIWRLEIEPYLEEVFFDRDDKLAKYRWDVIAPRVAPE